MRFEEHTPASSGVALREAPMEVHGAISFDVVKKGKVISHYENHNLITTLGRQRMAELLAGLSTGCVTHVGVGTGSTAATVDDTGLTDAVLTPVTSATADGKVARFNFVIDTKTANGLKICEFGLFCSDGAMFSHRTRTGIIEKANDIEINGYWEIRF